MLVRFLSPLPITITSRRGTKYTLSIAIESSSDRRELIMTEEGRCGYGGGLSGGYAGAFTGPYPVSLRLGRLFRRAVHNFDNP